MPAKKTRVRKNFVFPTDIVKWAEGYAKANNTTMTRIILDHFIKLRHQAEDHVEQI